MTGPEPTDHDVDAFFDELRSLLEITRTADLEEATAAGVRLADLRRQVADIGADLAPYVVDGVRMQAGLHSRQRPGGEPGRLPELHSTIPEEFFPYSPLIGPRNAMAPPFTFWVDDGEIHGTGRFRTIHNGPPGGAHGGMVAALLDEVMGLTGVVTGNHGFTGTLTVRYESLTPIDTDLTMRGWVEGAEGRKTFIASEVRDGDTLCARGTGIFIRPAD